MEMKHVADMTQDELARVIMSMSASTANNPIDAMLTLTKSLSLLTATIMSRVDENEESHEIDPIALAKAQDVSNKIVQVIGESDINIATGFMSLIMTLFVALMQCSEQFTTPGDELIH